MTSKSVPIQKTVFQRFIEANTKLIDCYERAGEKDIYKPDQTILNTC